MNLRNCTVVFIISNTCNLIRNKQYFILCTLNIVKFCIWLHWKIALIAILDVWRCWTKCVGMCMVLNEQLLFGPEKNKIFVFFSFLQYLWMLNKFFVKIFVMLYIHGKNWINYNFYDRKFVAFFYVSSSAWWWFQLTFLTIESCSIFNYLVPVSLTAEIIFWNFLTIN